MMTTAPPLAEEEPTTPAPLVKLATFAVTGDVLEDGHVVRHRWGMPVADGAYSTDLSFTDGTHQWYDHGQTITIVDHINEWHIP